MALRRKRATHDEVGAVAEGGGTGLMSVDFDEDDLPILIQEQDLEPEPQPDPDPFEYRIWKREGSNNYYQYEVRRKSIPDWQESGRTGAERSEAEALAKVREWVATRRNQLQTERNQESAEWRIM